MATFELGEGTVVFPLPDGWRVRERDAFSVTLSTPIRGAEVKAELTPYRDQQAVTGSELQPFLLPDDEEQPLEGQGLLNNYALFLRPDHRGMGPHAVLITFFVLPPDTIRRVEFALPLRELPQGEMASRFAAELPSIAPLSTLFAQVVPQGVAVDRRTRCDGAAIGGSEKRVSIEDCCHLRLPGNWLWETERQKNGATRHLFEAAEDRDLATLWADIGRSSIPRGQQLDEAALEQIAKGAADMLGGGEGAFTTEAPAWRLLGRDEAVITATLRFEDQGERVEDRAVVRVRAFPGELRQGYFHLVYPVVRLEQQSLCQLFDRITEGCREAWLSP